MQLHNTYKRSSGFTLLEVVLVLSILSILFVLSPFLTPDIYRGYAARTEEDTLVSVLTQARSRALANEGQSSWGVCLDHAAQTYVLFEGSSFNAGSTTAETIPKATASSEVSSLPDIFSCATGGIIFTQFTATTSSTTLTLQEHARSSRISINYEGAIN